MQELQSLKHKQILLLAPRFYGLQFSIKDELEKMGATVVWMESILFKEDIRNNSNKMVCILRNIINPCYRRKHTNDLLRIARSHSFDILITIFNYSPSYRLIKYLKRKNSNFKSYIYFWDAFSTWNFKYQMKYFDYKYSFDLNDCKRWENEGLEHLPLFWTNEQIHESCNNYIYDIVHIGSLHIKYRDRLSLVTQLYESAKKQQLNSYIGLVASLGSEKGFGYSLKMHLRYLIDVNFRRYIKEIAAAKDTYSNLIFTKPFALDDVHSIERCARCIVDINMNRAGVAIRVIAALANGQKVITNNRYIVEESFYSPENVFVLDSNYPEIDKEWLLSPVSKVDMSALRIDNWLKHILRV